MFVGYGISLGKLRRINRRRGTEFLDENLERVRRGKEDLSVIMIDLDRFKDVNDRYGHLAGDALLRHVADLIRKASRKYDFAARWGGDEILLLCPHAGESDAVTIAERIRHGLAECPVVVDGATFHGSASIGAATAHSGDDVTAAQLLAMADEFLYDAKAAGRNTVKCGPMPRARAQERQEN